MRQLVVDLASQPIINLTKNSKLSVISDLYTIGTGGQATTLIAAPGPDGQTSVVRRHRVVGQGAGVLGLGTGTDKALGPGVYTYAMKVRGFSTGAIRAYRENISGTHINIDASPTVPADGIWRTIWLTFRCTEAGRPKMGFLASAETEDGWVEVASCICVEGSVPPLDYMDGDTPGWRWTGTPQLSESVGYPYTLDSIVGRPLGDLSSPGQILLSGETSTSSMTMYLVGNRLSDAAAWADLHGVNVNLTGFSQSTGFGISQVGGGTLNKWMSRVDTSPTSGTPGYNQTSPQTSSVSIGRHVFAAQVASNMTVMRTYLEGSLATTRPITANSGVERNRLVMQAATGSFVPERLLLFGDEHNTQTIARVSAWLARKYGSVIPAGY